MTDSSFRLLSFLFKRHNQKQYRKAIRSQKRASGFERLEDRNLLCGGDHISVIVNNIFDVPSSTCVDAPSGAGLVISADGSINGQKLAFDSDDDGEIDQDQTADIITSIDITGSFGADHIDLSAVSVAAFPNLKWRGEYLNALDARQHENAWYEFAPVRILGDNDDITDANPTSGGDDMIVGSEFDDTIYGQIGNNTVLGGPGEDFIVTGTGDDILSGQQDDDWFYYGIPLDVGLLDLPLIDFEGDSDRIFGGSGEDRLIVAKHALPGVSEASEQAFLVDKSDDGTRIIQSGESPFELFLGEIESAEIQTRALTKSELSYMGSASDFGYLLYDGYGSLANHDFDISLTPQDEMAINVLVNEHSTNVADIDAWTPNIVVDNLIRTIDIDDSLDHQYDTRVFGGTLVAELIEEDSVGNAVSSVVTFSKGLADHQPLDFLRVFGSDAAEEFSIDTVYFVPGPDPDELFGTMTPLVPSLVIDGNQMDVTGNQDALDTFTVFGAIQPPGDRWRLTGPTGIRSPSIGLFGELEGGNFSINASDAANFQLRPLGLFNDTTIDASTVRNYTGVLSLEHDSRATASNEVIVVAGESDGDLLMRSFLQENPVDIIYANTLGSDRHTLVRLDNANPNKSRPTVTFDTSNSDANIAFDPEAAFGRKIVVTGNDETTEVALEGFKGFVSSIQTDYLDTQSKIFVRANENFSGQSAPPTGIVEVNNVSALRDFVGEDITRLTSIGSDQSDTVDAEITADGIRVRWQGFPDSILTPNALIESGIVKIDTGAGQDTVLVNTPTNAAVLDLGNELTSITVDSGSDNDFIQADYDSPSIKVIRIYGNEGDDEIVAYRGVSNLSGGAGNDVIRDGYHNNRIYGDEGNDVYFMNYSAQQDGTREQNHDIVSVLDGDLLDFLQSDSAIQINLDTNLTQRINEFGDTLRLYGASDLLPPEVSSFFGSEKADRISVRATPAFASASRSSRTIDGRSPESSSDSDTLIYFYDGAEQQHVTVDATATEGTLSVDGFDTHYKSIGNAQLVPTFWKGALDGSNSFRIAPVDDGSLGAVSTRLDAIANEIVIQGSSFESDIGSLVDGELRIPVDQIPSGLIAFDGSEHDESLTLDFSGGDLPVAFQFIGNGGNDAVSVVGGSFDNSELTYSNATDGTLIVDGVQMTFVSVQSLDLSESEFQNLEIRTPAVLPVTESIIGSDHAPTQIRSLDSGSGTLSFVNPSGTLNFVNDGSNQPPTINAISSQEIEEGHELTFTAIGMDPDGLLGTVTYLLPTPPLGATIDPVTGVFRWTPSERQGPSEYDVTVRVRDNGLPVQFSEAVVHIVVIDTSPFQNSAQIQDVNDDGRVSAHDALLIINFLNHNADTTLDQPSDPSKIASYVDVDGNNVVSAADALIVINFMNQLSAQSEEVDLSLPVWLRDDDDRLPHFEAEIISLDTPIQLLN